MITLQGVAAEVLPVDKFGEYMRKHIVERSKHYLRDVLIDAFKQLNPEVGEHEISQWLDNRWNLEKEKWKTEIEPIIKREIEKNAQYYVRMHKGEEE